MRQNEPRRGRVLTFPFATRPMRSSAGLMCDGPKSSSRTRYESVPVRIERGLRYASDNHLDAGSATPSARAVSIIVRNGDCHGSEVGIPNPF